MLSIIVVAIPEGQTGSKDHLSKMKSKAIDE